METYKKEFRSNSSLNSSLHSCCLKVGKDQDNGRRSRRTAGNSKSLQENTCQQIHIIIIITIIIMDWHKQNKFKQHIISKCFYNHLSKTS